MITGRCYCGHVTIRSASPPIAATYCHCDDCRRWTGAPAPAFAAFDATDLEITVDLPPRSFADGVNRWTCPECGSPMAATFSYLPGQVYVPLGVLDQANDIPPKLHCHADYALEWLNLDDALPRSAASGREQLNSKRYKPA